MAVVELALARLARTSAGAAGAGHGPARDFVGRRCERGHGRHRPGDHSTIGVPGSPLWDVRMDVGDGQGFGFGIQPSSSRTAEGRRTGRRRQSYLRFHQAAALFRDVPFSFSFSGDGWYITISGGIALYPTLSVEGVGGSPPAAHSLLLSLEEQDSARIPGGPATSTGASCPACRSITSPTPAA